MGSDPNLIKSPGDYNLYTDYTFVDFWKQNNKKYSFTREQAGAVLKKFAKMVHEEVLNNPDGFRLPSNVGTIIISGNKGFPKDNKRSTPDKIIEHRNVHSDGLVFSCDYIFGLGRGRCYGSLLWRFRTTVPLRKAIQKRVLDNDYQHWLVVDKIKDIIRYDIPAHIPRKGQRKRKIKTNEHS